MDAECLIIDDATRATLAVGHFWSSLPLLDRRKVPELAEEFAKRKSQKHEAGQTGTDAVLLHAHAEIVENTGKLSKQT